MSTPNTFNLSDANNKIVEMIKTGIKLESVGNIAEAAENAMDVVKYIQALMVTFQTNQTYYTSIGVTADGLEKLNNTKLNQMMRAITLASLVRGTLGPASLKFTDLRDLEKDLQKAIDGAGAKQNSSDDVTIDEFDLSLDVDQIGNGIFTVNRDLSSAPQLSNFSGYENEQYDMTQLLSKETFVRNNEEFTKQLEPVKKSVPQTITSKTGQTFTIRPNAVANNMLLYGPPGTGKTEQVYAFARKNNATLMVVNTSSFIQRYYGLGERNMHIMAKCARLLARQTNKRTFVLIDEIDGIIGDRSGGKKLESWEESRITTLLQILLPNDGVSDNSDVNYFGVTNVPLALDGAIRSRFKIIFFGFMSKPEDRTQLFKNIMGNFLTDPDTACTLAASLFLEFVPRDIIKFKSSTFASTLVKRMYEKNDFSLTMNTDEFINLLSTFTVATTVEQFLKTFSSALPEPTLKRYIDYNHPQEEKEPYLTLKKLYNNNVKLLETMHAKLLATNQ